MELSITLEIYIREGSRVDEGLTYLVDTTDERTSRIRKAKESNGVGLHIELDRALTKSDILDIDRTYQCVSMYISSFSHWDIVDLHLKVSTER